MSRGLKLAAPQVPGLVSECPRALATHRVARKERPLRAKVISSTGTRRPSSFTNRTASENDKVAQAMAAAPFCQSRAKGARRKEGGVGGVGGVVGGGGDAVGWGAVAVVSNDDAGAAGGLGGAAVVSRGGRGDADAAAAFAADDFGLAPPPGGRSAWSISDQAVKRGSVRVARSCRRPSFFLGERRGERARVLQKNFFFYARSGSEGLFREKAMITRE
jgi:hypothetical protein